MSSSPATGARPRPVGILTGELALDGQRLVGIDGGPRSSLRRAVSFQVTCETPDEIDDSWQRLPDRGQPGPCGWLKDRCGRSWQVVPAGLPEPFSDPDPQLAEPAMRAMLSMRTPDIAALREAADARRARERPSP